MVFDFLVSNIMASGHDIQPFGFLPSGSLGSTPSLSGIQSLPLTLTSASQSQISSIGSTPTYTSALLNNSSPTTMASADHSGISSIGSTPSIVGNDNVIISDVNDISGVNNVVVSNNNVVSGIDVVSSNNNVVSGINNVVVSNNSVVSDVNVVASNNNVVSGMNIGASNVASRIIPGHVNSNNVASRLLSNVIGGPNGPHLMPNGNVAGLLGIPVRPAGPNGPQFGTMPNGNVPGLLGVPVRPAGLLGVPVRPVRPAPLNFAATAAVRHPNQGFQYANLPGVKRPNTLIFKLPFIDNQWSRKDIIREIFKSIPEKCLHAIQIIPANWCRLTFIKVEDKHSFLIRGFSFNGNHIDFQEAEPSVTFVTLSHLPVEVPAEHISRTLSQFGKVLSVNHQHDKDFRSLLTGNRIVKMILQGQHLPPRLRICGFFATVWYRGMPAICRLCFRQGHLASTCPYKGLCFRCGSADHTSKECHTVVGTAGPPAAQAPPARPTPQAPPARPVPPAPPDPPAQSAPLTPPAPSVSQTPQVPQAPPATPDAPVHPVSLAPPSVSEATEASRCRTLSESSSEMEVSDHLASAPPTACSSTDPSSEGTPNLFSPIPTSPDRSSSRQRFFDEESTDSSCSATSLKIVLSDVETDDTPVSKRIKS